MAILRGSVATTFDLLGNELVSQQVGYALGHVAGIGQSQYVSLTAHRPHPAFFGSWYDIRTRDPINLGSVRMILFSPAGDDGTDIASGDFDGDQMDDILVVDGAASVVFGVMTEPCVATRILGPEPAIGVAIGDHDGDGDDEAAVIQAGRVLILNRG
jgi:hypothetical protein